MSNKFLGGENVNLVINQIISGLGKYGVDPDIKSLQTKIPDFMYKVSNQYPQGKLTDLNNITIQKVLEKYIQNRQFGGSPNNRSRASEVNNKFEQALLERNYQQAHQQNQPPLQPDFTQPIGSPSNPGGGMNLSQLGIDPNQSTSTYNNYQQRPQNSNHVPISPVEYNPDLDFDPQNSNPSNSNPSNSNLSNSNPSNSNPSTPFNLNTNQKPIWLTLNRENLVDSEGNQFTFSWNQKKLFPDFKQHLILSLKYITIPKYLPYLLIKYSCPSSLPHQELNQLYSATGKKYSAKLIPCHTNGQNTTYQALGEHFIVYEELPTSISFEIIPPTEYLDLQKIQVIKASKHNSQIHITTKSPHNLGQRDALILEFPKQHACYKVSHLQILDPYQILVDSPFVGYFSSDFSLLRSNWNLDLTLHCQLN